MSGGGERMENERAQAAVGPETPVLEAAARVLDARLRAVAKRLGEVRELGRPGQGDATGPKERMRAVHRLRVATRRAGSALRLFRAWIEEGEYRKTTKVLRRVRRAAAGARDADVRGAVLEDLRAAVRGSPAPTLDYLVERVGEERSSAFAALAAGGIATLRVQVRRRRRRVRRSLRAREGMTVEAADGGAMPVLFRDAARAAAPEAVEMAREAAGGDLTQIERLHALRKALKRLRYMLELAAPALGGAALKDGRDRLEEIQARLGEINDADATARWLAGEAEALRASGGGNGRGGAGLEGVAALTDRYFAMRDRRVERFLAEHGAGKIGAVLDSIEAACGVGEAGVHQAPGAEWGEVGGVREMAAALVEQGNGEGIRLAAIDVGSNSTRLVIVEAHADGSYRVLDDEREPMRLAAGLVKAGALDEAVMSRAADAIAGMKGIADGYGCAAVRAIATAAVREASNGAAFTALVKERTGLELRVVSADEEARLAFLSASRAFSDLGTIAAGVMDIGGASTEIVLSSRGVVESIASTPLGAVRLAEMFGADGEGAYKRMRRWIKGTVRSAVGKPAVRPDVMVGMGGTVTALAAIAAHRRRVAPPPGAASGQGFQVRYEEVKEILGELRDLPLEKRKRVPGLSAERADIIVAGVAVIEFVMRHLGAPRLRVHARGVRDGVILRMIGDVVAAGAKPAPAQARQNRLAAARRLAQTCRSEQRHSEHVAKLALQIFDGLEPLLPEPNDLWTTPVARDLLEAGAVLHDIGYIVSYAKHHRHAYHLILHADALRSGPGAFSHREVQVIACLARYHRRSEPHERDEELSGLSDEDRMLLRRLAAVLRIADGLDRTHSQNVSGVRLRVEPGSVAIELEAAEDPATDIWGAARKAGLFGAVFGAEPRFVWRGAASAAAAPEGARVGEPATV